MARKVKWVAMDRKTYCKRQKEAFKKANRKSHIVAADELISAVTKVLMRSEGETIAQFAKDAGLDVEYVGDSMFRVYEG